MKTTTPLSEDQRWLLWTVGLTITRPLLSNEGLERFMQSRNGSYGRPREGAPEWLRGHQVRGGAVVSLPESAVGVKVTAAQIRAFRKTIPTEPLTELATIDSAEMDEHWRTELWCYCHRANGEVLPHKDFLQRDQYHPTEAEETDHLITVMDLRDRERDCLRTIFGLTPVRFGQLELFEVTS